VRGINADEEPYLGKNRQFGGIHSGGCNCLCADGAVQFIDESIEGAIFAGMTTIAIQGETAGERQLKMGDAKAE
jgi:hypothetical protein